MDGLYSGAHRENVHEGAVALGRGAQCSPAWLGKGTSNVSLQRGSLVVPNLSVGKVCGLTKSPPSASVPRRLSVTRTAETDRPLFRTTDYWQMHFAVVTAILMKTTLFFLLFKASDIAHLVLSNHPDTALFNTLYPVGKYRLVVLPTLLHQYLGGGQYGNMASAANRTGLRTH